VVETDWIVIRWVGKRRNPKSWEGRNPMDWKGRNPMH